MPARRGFLGRVAAGIAALTAVPLLPVLGEEPPPAPSHKGRRGAAPRESAWDDSWVERVTAPHRMVFDSPEISDGLVLHQARTWMQGYRDVFGTGDDQHSGVLVIRHRAVPMVLADALWDRWELGKEYKLKDPTTGEPARRNPFVNVKADDKHAVTWADGTLDGLVSRGVIVLACNIALQRWIGRFARDEKIERAEADRTLKSQYLIEGAIVQPSGIYAVARAQEVGCHFLQI